MFLVQTLNRVPIATRLTVLFIGGAMMTVLIAGLLGWSNARQGTFIRVLADQDMAVVSQTVEMRTHLESYNARLMGVLGEIYSQPGSVAAVDKTADALTAAWRKVLAVNHSQTDTSGLAAAVDRFAPMHQKVRERLRDGKFTMALYDEWIDIHAGLRKETQLILDSLNTHLQDNIREEQGTAAMLTMLGGIVVSLSILGVIAAVWMVLRTVAKPLGEIIASTRDLADGNLAAAIPHGDRGDEVGKLADALEVFRRNLLTVRDLQQQRERAERADAERRAATDRLQAAFHHRADGLLDQVRGAIAVVDQAIAEMSASIDQTGRQSHAVTTAMAEASSNVDDAAAEAERLSDTISAIDDRTLRAADMAAQAVRLTEAGDAAVSGLADAVEHIGTVVSAIGQVARRTNLLALNAAIEAERAGEAGKGFAVVANEVKGLARQTTAATVEIRQHIDGVRAATQQAVTQIRQSAQTIEGINGLVAEIAVAVRDQAGATRRISGNVRDASAVTRTVSEAMSDVGQAVVATESNAGAVVAITRSLVGHSDALSDEVTQFLSGIAAVSAKASEAQE